MDRLEALKEALYHNRVELLRDVKKPDSRQSPDDRRAVLSILPLTNMVIDASNRNSWATTQPAIP